MIGVPRFAFSCLITAEAQERGVSMISEGKEEDLGVWRGGRTGLVTAGILRTTTRESVYEAFEVDADK